MVVAAAVEAAADVAVLPLKLKDGCALVVAPKETPLGTAPPWTAVDVVGVLKVNVEAFVPPWKPLPNGKPD